MSNLLQWLVLFLAPWLTLIFMKAKDIKRFFPLALASALTSVMIHNAGVTFQWWVDMQPPYPVEVPPYLLGMFPVLTMWIFKFTYRKFWWFIAVEVVMNLGFDFVFLPIILKVWNIEQYITMTGIVAFCITTVHGLILYAYQMWQEGIFAHRYREERTDDKER